MHGNRGPRGQLVVLRVDLESKQELGGYGHMNKMGDHAVVIALKLRNRVVDFVLLVIIFYFRYIINTDNKNDNIRWHMLSNIVYNSNIK